MKSIKPAIFTCFKGYNLSYFLKDLMSGILVAIIALPLSIALGIQSGATLQQGIITAFIAGFIISALGGSTVQIGGPTAAFVSIIVGYIASIGFLGLTMATIMAGCIMILLGVFRVGGLVKYIPYPIVIGFTSGIGVTLLVGQLADFTGIKLASGFSVFEGLPQIISSGFVDKLANLGTNIATFNLASFLIGILTLAFLIILPKINKKIPSAFVALIVTTVITVIIGLFNKDRFGISTIGSLYPNVKAEFFIPDFASIPKLNFAKLILPSIVIAFLGSVESLLSATVADNLTGKKHDSNAELIGEGLANIASGLVGGLPATGAIARTAANIQNGGTTPIAGIVHSLMLALMFFVLMPVVKFIPMASLGAILIMVSINMANFKLFAKLTTFNKKDLAILLVTFILTVYKDLVYGVCGGLVVTFMLMANDIFVKNKIEVKHIENENQNKQKVITPHCNLTFLNYNKVINHCTDNLEEFAEIIIDCSNIKRADISSLEKLKTFKKSLENKNINMTFVGANEKLSLHIQKAINL